jgi:phospholipid/cholesterol/gamma-HCH transport system permease protein
MLTFLRHTGLATFAALFQSPFWAFSQCVWRLLIYSLPITAVIAFFSGAVLLTHAVSALALVGGGPVSGYIVALGGVRELFPLLAASALACRAGGEISSELAALKLGQQLEAVEGMGVNSYRLLVGPRVLACMVGSALLVPISDVIGLCSAYWVGVYQLSIDPGNMQESLLIWLRFSDLAVGMLKGFLFGWLVGIISTYEGVHAKGGANGIGQAASRAVVRSMIAGYLLSFALSYAIYGNSSLG